ncbi:MAG: hypothetical protein HGA75_04980 [Thiobacillus sp.]|nr:hypothetical protein [Thiobacillus sp.]
MNLAGITVPIVAWLLAGCVSQPPKTLFDHIEAEIAQRNWTAAYLLIEDSLVATDADTRQRAMMLIASHPEIGRAAAESFTEASLENARRINAKLAATRARKRLDNYRQGIATPEEYAQAEQNYARVFDAARQDVAAAAPIRLPVAYPAPEHQPLGERLAVNVRPIRADDLLSPEELASARVGKLLGAGILLFPPMAAQMLGHALGEGIFRAGEKRSGKGDGRIVDAAAVRRFIAMTAERVERRRGRTGEQPALGQALELVIDHFDVSVDNCFLVDAYLFIKTDDKRVYAERLAIGPAYLSEDAPAVECVQPGSRSVPDDRGLERAALRYADALAEMTARRLRWQQ